MIPISQILLGSVVTWVIWNILCIEANVRKARAIKVPFVRIPFEGNGALWSVLQPIVWSILDSLPIPWSSYPDFVRYSRRGWHFVENVAPHLAMGPIWALVTPAACHLHVADPEAIAEITSRRRDFVRPFEDFKILEVYGPCISTAGPEGWARHRKVIAPPFNNDTMLHFVWGESLRQGRAMLRSWKGASEAGVPSVQKDTRLLSANVLASSTFHESYNFRGSADPAASVVDNAGNYRDALHTVLDNIIITLLIPYRFLKAPLPKKWVVIGDAARAFKEHMRRMLDSELKAAKDGLPGSGPLMSAMVRALDLHKREESASAEPKDRKGLSIDEVFGNIFAINFAAHDSTANTLAFAMLLLAAHPEVQAWVSEEIEQVTRDMPAGEAEWDYKATFPELKRCRAVLYETLRLFPPIMALPKATGSKAQALKIDGKTFVIPPNMGITITVISLHKHPRYWANPTEWRPARWIINKKGDDSNGINSASVADEEFHEPDRTLFMAFGQGPMSCLGRKFFEVQAVAILACIFRNHRVAVKRNVGESEEAARKRAVACTNDVDMQLLLRMRNADQITLICKEA